MQRLLFTALLLGSALTLRAQPDSAPAAGELTKLLQDFLAGASRNEVAVHERFWADDLIYTASAGRRLGKAEILREVRAEPRPGSGNEDTIYSAEEIRVQQYGETAIVAFRLRAADKKTGEVKNYLNSGTFLRRNGEWRVVSWQATAIPQTPSPTPPPQKSPSA